MINDDIAMMAIFGVFVLILLLVAIYADHHRALEKEALTPKVADDTSSETIAIICAETMSSDNL